MADGTPAPYVIPTSERAIDDVIYNIQGPAEHSGYYDVTNTTSYDFNMTDYDDWGDYTQDIYERARVILLKPYAIIIIILVGILSNVYVNVHTST